MRHHYYNYLQDNIVATVTILLVMAVMTTGGNHIKHASVKDVTNISFDHTLINHTRLNTGTSDNPLITLFKDMDDELTSNIIAVAAELVQTTSELSIIPDDVQSSGNVAGLTTIRPFIIPTLPEFRHRITNSRPYQSKHHHEHHWGPFFEEPLMASTGTIQASAHLGTESLLNCRVGMLRDKTVMWIRKTTDKVSLLTVGNNTYSSDPRIDVKFQYPNNWRLHINPVQKEDAGLYMCQVSTHPPRVFATNVTILGPAIRVVDEHGHEVNDRYYKTESTIELTCQVAVSYLSTLQTIIPGTHPYLMMPNPISTKIDIPSIDKTIPLHNNDNKNITKIDYYHQKLIWHKDGEPLPKDSYLNLSSTTEWRNSRLSIPHADRTHSGVYSCSIMNSSTAVVHVQILNGETPAAVQHNSVDGKKSFSTFIIFIIIFLPLFDISC